MNKTKKKKITKVSNDTSAILIVAAMILVVAIGIGSIIFGKINKNDNDDKKTTNSDIVDDLPENFKKNIRRWLFR